MDYIASIDGHRCTDLWRFVTSALTVFLLVYGETPIVHASVENR